jgi:thiol-disulfide isomerase/thioredoxin
MSEELASLNKKIHHEKLGGRKTRRHTEKTHKKKNVIVVGKVYANWCGHCQALKPEWKKMKQHISKKKGRNHFVFVEIEESEIHSKLDKLNKDHNVVVQASGFPTLFRIEGGKVEYYGGNRQSNQMSNWYLKGGDSLQLQPQIGMGMPGLMQDVQGQGPVTEGGRRNFKKYSKRRYTAKRFYQKKPTGLFDFLCGK